MEESQPVQTNKATGSVFSLVDVPQKETVTMQWLLILAMSETQTTLLQSMKYFDLHLANIQI